MIKHPVYLVRTVVAKESAKVKMFFKRFDAHMIDNDTPFFFLESKKDLPTDRAIEFPDKDCVLVIGGSGNFEGKWYNINFLYCDEFGKEDIVLYVNLTQSLYDELCRSSEMISEGRNQIDPVALKDFEKYPRKKLECPGKICFPSDGNLRVGRHEINSYFQGFDKQTVYANALFVPDEFLKKNVVQPDKETNNPPTHLSTHKPSTTDYRRSAFVLAASAQGLLSIWLAAQQKPSSPKYRSSLSRLQARFGPLNRFEMCDVMFVTGGMVPAYTVETGRHAVLSWVHRKRGKGGHAWANRAAYLISVLGAAVYQDKTMAIAFVSAAMAAEVMRAATREGHIRKGKLEHRNSRLYVPDGLRTRKDWLSKFPRMLEALFTNPLNGNARSMSDCYLLARSSLGLDLLGNDVKIIHKN
jgi:hypothetical protein